MFLEQDGFQYILKVFMNLNLSQSDATAHQSKQHAEFALKHITFLLKILRIFIMAAFSTSTQEQSIYRAASLVRRSSSIQEDGSSAIESPVQIEPAHSSANEGSRFKQLQNLMAGPIGEEIISTIDYQLLTNKILTIISQILGKESMIMEDKLIIENALSLLVGCILHKNELMNDFYNFSSPTIPSFDQFVLEGLLLCKQEKVREEFKQSLSCLSKSVLNASVVRELPLFYLLRLLGDKFSIISEYPCKQFFELFCELIDQYFIARSLGSAGQVFNPETLLSQIIDKIKEYNKLAQTKNPAAQSATAAPQQ